MPIAEVLLWIIYRWIDSSIINQIRRILWLPFEQYADVSLKKAAYNHIMGLSREFHTRKRSGELFTAIGQGHSLKSILQVLLFRVVPIISDLTVAFIYLCWIFGPYMALIVATTTVVFLWTSAYFVDRQSEPRRRYTGLARRENQVMYDSVGGYVQSTVTCPYTTPQSGAVSPEKGSFPRAHTDFDIRLDGARSHTLTVANMNKIVMRKSSVSSRLR